MLYFVSIRVFSRFLQIANQPVLHWNILRNLHGYSHHQTREEAVGQLWLVGSGKHSTRPRNSTDYKGQISSWRASLDQRTHGTTPLLNTPRLNLQHTQEETSPPSLSLKVHLPREQVLLRHYTPLRSFPIPSQRTSTLVVASPLQRLPLSQTHI